MSGQLDLIPNEVLKIDPKSDRAQPQLWVRRLAIWSKPGELLRQVTLRRGLNIVWSPDPAEQTRELGRATGLGHGSGKTLFCRLLRYCLGESTFAPDDERHRIVLAFPEGIVGAEVLVDGRCWAILRPIGMGRKHFAIPDADLDTIANGGVEATGIDPFLEVIESNILSPDVVSLVPGDRPLHAWLVALAWLTRDQECRFHHVLDWRAEESNSGSPRRALSRSSTLDALRALIGAIVRDEYDVRATIERIELEQGQIREESNRQEWGANQIRSRLVAALGLREDNLPGGRMDVEVLRKAATAALVQLKTVDSASDVTDIDALRKEADAAQERVDELERNLAAVQARIPEIQRQVSMIAAELPRLHNSAQMAGSPVCPICEVPIDRALAEGCKLSHKLPDAQVIRARWEKTKQSHVDESARLTQERDVQARLTRDLAPASELAGRLRDHLRAAEALRNSRSDAWHAKRSLIDDVNRLDDALAARDHAQSTTNELADLIKRRREEIGVFRTAQAAVFQRVSHVFDAITRELVGPGSKGSVLLDGKGLGLSVQMGGERSTAAIDSLKVLSFDLSVLCMSIEGATRLPAFLVHDSPREADLGLSVYHRLFRLAVELESCGREPMFQYILTTTTRPPEDLLSAPWHVGTLHGSPAVDRLLRRDL